jgi:hypothetical protein
VRWHRRGSSGFERVAPEADGIDRSHVFPGLWLDGKALLDKDIARVLAVLQQGLNTPEHAEFVRQLAGRRGRDS